MNILQQVKSLCLKVLAFMGRKLKRTPLARSPFLNRVHAAWSLRLHGAQEVTVGDFKVRIDPRDRVIAKKLVLYDGFEEKELALLCGLAKPGDCVLDIGANIGLYALHLSRAVGEAGRVLAVEPDPDNRALLETNLEMNGCANVTILPFALSDEPGSAELFQVYDNRGYLSFADLGGTGESRSVEVRRGEDVLNELRMRPTLAKIDVEGAEPQVFSGLGELKPDIIMFEFVPAQLRALNHDPAEFLEKLVSEGYGLEIIDPDSGERTALAPRSLLEYAENDKSREYNILARR